MSDRPILMSAPMVRACLDGSKTQTRRGLYLKRLAKDGGAAIPSKFSIYHGLNAQGDQVRCDPPMLSLDHDPMGTWWAINPLVKLKPGDRLWVKETWRTYISLDAEKPTDLWSPEQARGAAIFYAAGGDMAIAKDGSGQRSYGEDDGGTGAGKTRVSIHMPKWASRLTLTITGKRVERLHDIGLRDAMAEGCEVRQFWLFGADAQERDAIGRAVYANLWRSINGPDSWAANPWVIVLSFRTERRNIEEIDRG